MLLRLPDRSDYTSGGLKAKDVPDNLSDGRGLWAESGIEAQVAVLGEDVSGAAQSALVRELGASLTAVERAEGPVPESLHPFSLAALPSEIDAATALASPAPLPRGHIPVGIGGDRLALVSVDAANTPMLVRRSAVQRSHQRAPASSAVGRGRTAGRSWGSRRAPTCSATTWVPTA